MKSPLCDDKSLLVSYLYGECDDAERRAIEEHLAGCARCAGEIAGLRGVQDTLRQWTPPEQALGFRMVRDEQPRGRVLGWRRPDGGIRVPAWAQAIAAVLVLAVAAAIANLDVRIANGGVTIQTGWQKARVEQARAQAPAAGQAAPWRTEFTAFKSEIDERLSRAVAAPVSTGPSPAARDRLSADETAAILHRVQALIDDSERRQQGEVDRVVAERMLRLSRDFSAQRVSDLRNIQQGLGQMDVRTIQMQNYLMRIANVQEIK